VTLACALSLSGGAAAAAEADPRVDQLIGRIDQAQRGVRTLRAEFTQRNRVKLFKQELTSRGLLLYERGDGGSRLRWEYVAPDPSTMILAGGKATLLLPGRGPQEFSVAGDSTLRAIFAELELWLGNGSLRRAQAQGEYDMRASGDSKVPVLVLQPREKSPLSRTFSRIEMRLDGRTMLLKGLLLVERGGDEKDITFTRVDRDAALPPRAFSP
jgi:outer membrane lipoprotein-sorting protein